MVHDGGTGFNPWMEGLEAATEEKSKFREDVKDMDDTIHHLISGSIEKMQDIHCRNRR